MQNPLKKVTFQRAHLAKNLSTFEVIFSNIKNRNSVTKFLKKDVSDDIVQKLLEAASYAPSAGNHQPWEFIVVRDKRSIETLTASCFNQEWMINTPILIVVGLNMHLAAAVYGERGEKLYGIQDTAAAIENMLLAAHSLGLGACWVGAFSEPKVTLALHFPPHVRPVTIIAIGWPAEKAAPLTRQSLDDIVHYEIFGKTKRAASISVHGTG